MKAFIIRWFITTIAVMVATAIIPGIKYDSATTLLGASLVLGIVNALIRPILLILSLPFILVTMGLFIFVINALLLMFVSAIISNFQVSGFWTAFFGSVVISIVSWIMSAFFRGTDGRIHSITHHGSLKQARVREIK